MRARKILREQARQIVKDEAKILIDTNLALGEKCNRRLSFFVKEFWSVIIPDKLVWNWHLDILCNEIQVVYDRVIGYEVEDPNDPEKKIRVRLPKLYDLIINIPPGTSKSTICTIMAPAWSWGKDSSLRHMTGSYSANLSMDHSVKSRDIIKSDKYRRYFPNVIIKKDEDNKTNFRTTNNGQRFVTSTGGAATGVHAHIITIDDPLNPKQAASAVQLLEANNWFDKTLSTRKVDKDVTPTILIMQRLATDDPTGHLLEKRGNKIRHVCLPGSLESGTVKPSKYEKYYKDGLLDPLRLSRKVLGELKTDLGSSGFSGQVGQSPVPAAGLTWQKWFIEVPDEVFPPVSMMDKYGTDWDLAYTSDDENSASAYVSAGRIGVKRYIEDLDWKWLEFPELIKWMKSIKGPHYIEAKATGKSAKQTLTKLGIPAIEIAVKGGDKVARANMATPWAESGMVYIRKSLVDKLYNDSKQGILFFPKGPFTDLNDALTQSLQRLAQNSGLVVAGDEPDNSSDLDWLDHEF